MGLRIRTNVQSLNSQRNLGYSVQKAGKHMERLSSGYRINKSADDAAGLAISDNLNADIRSLYVARRNANDAVSLLQVAEGGLSEINNISTRLRELAVQSASDTIGNRERVFLNREYMQLKDEIDRIVLSTEFNGNRLLIGEGDGVPVELTENAAEQPLEIQVGKDYILPVDDASEPNQVNIIQIDFRQINAFTDGDGSLELGNSQDDGGTRVDSKFEAQRSISAISNAIQKIADYRSIIGSKQNRMVSASNNLSVQIENLSAAKSRIKDADFAAETAEFTQASILKEAGTSVLAQANSLPKTAIPLLQAM